MQRIWRPTRLGKLFTSTPDWHLAVIQDRYSLIVAEQSFSGNLRELEPLSVTPGVIWASVGFDVGVGRPITVDGIPNEKAQAMVKIIRSAIRQLNVQALLREFSDAIQPVVQWMETTHKACNHQLTRKGWLTREFTTAHDATKPRGLEHLLADPEVVRHVTQQAEEIQAAVRFWKGDFRRFADQLNARHLARELTASKRFFDRVERSPLSEEQARAVICFDNRILLVASAGSGKTSTMVAKAGYALSKGYVAPERMLLLAFNKDAAAELRERLKDRLSPLGLPADRVVAKTFHAFGLDVIGQATGKRPSIAPWIETGRDLEVLLELVDQLKDQNPMFRTHWDLFRIVLGQDLPSFGKEQDAPDAWDRDTRKEGFWTLNGEVVKSRGEQLIANWLFYNGVSYRYEMPYPIDTADSDHRQYCPDFYFPDIDTYLEHWAVDAWGNPPPEFVGYKDGMAWKRALHQQHGTRLLETTMADLWSGNAFQYLAQELEQLGLQLDPNPDRSANGRKPIENPRLARTFRTFLTHVKSNRLSMADLRQRLSEGVAGRFQFRHAMFLTIFEALWTAWEDRLHQDQGIDFDDMLNLASDHLEQGRWDSPYELVMVDEFQDVSQARARLVRNLVNKPDRCLFAVGDDWQSINRFAGSDLSVMTEFESHFGKAVTLKLETTFRCPQSLCDISSQFVQKNGQQLRKVVRSSKSNVTQPVRIIQVEEERQVRGAIARRIQELVSDGVPAGRRLRVYILGRYNMDRELMPAQWDTEVMDVEFVTVHSSKGLEADHVIVPRMTSETLGFPSRIEDDPVMRLAMPGGETFEFAEERRLFYVALTRARTSVTLVTLAHKQSPFIAELVRDHHIEIVDQLGGDIAAKVCPTCKTGFMVRKSGKFGPFLGCSTYPKCRHTEKIAAQTSTTRKNGASEPVGWM